MTFIAHGGVNLKPESTLSLTREGEFKYRSVEGYLNRQEVDVACAKSFFLGEVLFHTTEPLPALTHTESFWIIKKPQLITGWKTLVIEFSWDIWVAVFFTFFLTSGGMYVYLRLKDIHIPYPNILFSVYGMHLDNPPKNFVGFRPGLCIFLLYLMVVTTVYKSELISVITNPRQEAQIKSLEEGMAKGYTLFLFNAMKGWIEANPIENTVLNKALKSGQLQYYRLGSHYDKIQNLSHSISVFDNVIESKTLSREQSQPYTDYLLRTYDFLPGSSFVTQEGAYMSPAHPLLPIFRRKQQQVIEAGWEICWEWQWHKEIKKFPRVETSNDPKPITLSQIDAFFGLYLACIIFSFICFIFEGIVNFLVARVGAQRTPL